MKIVINRCFGGFGLSPKALEMYRDMTQNPQVDYWEIPRDDSTLIHIVETLGKESFGDHSELYVITIPDGVVWQIEDYDGMEHVAEKHRVWY